MPDFPQLENETIVVRAILQKDWVKKDGTPHRKAFKRFMNDTNGVSVSFTREQAKAQFERPIAGTCLLKVEKIREIQTDEFSLDVIRDRIDHANITGIPFIYNVEGEERTRLDDVMTFLTGQLAKIAFDIVKEDS